MNSSLTAKTGMKDTIPTLAGYIGVGLAFGVVAKAAGLSVFVIILMSVVTYSGAAQFVIVSMLLAGSTFFAILTSVFFIINTDVFDGHDSRSLFKPGINDEKYYLRISIDR